MKTHFLPRGGLWSVLCRNHALRWPPEPSDGRGKETGGCSWKVSVSTSHDDMAVLDEFFGGKSHLLQLAARGLAELRMSRRWQSQPEETPSVEAKLNSYQRASARDT